MFEDIVEIEEIGYEDTFDLEIDSKFHNFYANGVCVSNSHSLSYSYLALGTLYLKHYYPTEFYTSLLNYPKTSGSKDKQKLWLSSAVSSAMSKSINIKPPSLKSGWKWTMTGEREISMGFSSINGMGDKAYEELIRVVKESGNSMEKISMNSFFNLTFSQFNKRAFEACLKAGVFDHWCPSRDFLLERWMSSRKNNKKTAKNNLTLFDLSSDDLNPKWDEKIYPPISEEAKELEFISVCNFDLNQAKKLFEIKDKLREIEGIPIESVLNYDKPGKYFFILKEFKGLTSQNGNFYVDLKVGDGINFTRIRMFGDLAVNTYSHLQSGAVYLASFSKNNKGFINFDKKYNPTTRKKEYCEIRKLT